MVQVKPTGNGQEVAEVAPACEHGAMAPLWTDCEECGTPCRHWRCLHGCTHQVADPGHTQRDGTPCPAAQPF